MNSQEQQESPSFELPAAHVPEQHGATKFENSPQGEEIKNELSVESGIAQNQLPPASPPPTNPTNAQPTTTSTQTSQDGGMGSAAPPVAEDIDLIEKEWVLIAKEIVSKTAHDPHMQNTEINKFKADYLKKRYNKEIKLSEDI